jgi:alkylation response protein AidB-like acyl-CoA dehydrogenase
MLTRVGTSSEPVHPLVARAGELDELIRKSAEDNERAGNLQPDVVDAMREAGLFGVLVAREVGGQAAGLMTAFELFETVSRADGSTGWVLMATGTGTALVAANVGDGAIDAVFGARDGRTIAAGMLAPGGTCIPVDGGFVGSGRYQFGSGAAHADWIGAGMLVSEGDAPRRSPSGLVEVRAMVVPRERVELRGNWEVAGFAGTGSFDYVVPEQFIGDDFTFEVASVEPRRGGRQLELGIHGLAAVGHSAVALGITARALEELARLMAGKKRIGYGGAIGDHALFQFEFAHHEAMYQATRAYATQTIETVQGVLDGDDPLSDEMRSRLRQMMTYVHRACPEIVAWCYRWAGTDALRSRHPIGRCLRDLNGATQHIFVDPLTYVDAAPVLIERWRRDDVEPG